MPNTIEGRGSLRAAGLALVLEACTPKAVVATILPDPDETRVDAASQIDAASATELSVNTEERVAVVALPPGTTVKSANR